MEKKIIINRVDLGQRVTGYELMNVSANGKEIVGYTPKQMFDAVRAGEVMGMVLNAAGELELDKDYNELLRAKLAEKRPPLCRGPTLRRCLLVKSPSCF